MKKISIQVAITDDSFFEWFIEPRQASGELPNLVLRLLTAYANNDKLACELDQYLDEQENPEVYAARQKILDALAQLNAMDASVDQELESLNSEEFGEATGEDDDDDEFDIVTSGGGTESWSEEGHSFTPDGGVISPKLGTTTESNAKAFSFTPESVASELKQRISSDTVKPVEAQAEPQVVAPVASSGTTSEFESKMFIALDKLTAQISQLTSAVTQVIIPGAVQTVVAPQPAVETAQPAVETAQPAVETAQPVVEAYEQVIQPIEMPKQETQPAVTAPVAETPAVEPATPVVEPATPVISKADIPAPPAYNPQPSGITLAKPAEPVAEESNSADDEAVPAFLYGFMDSLGQ